MADNSRIVQAYKLAQQAYADLGVDTDAAIHTLGKIAVSMHCWQGDDVAGFESDQGLDGGLVATGNYPGKATTADQLRMDVDKAFSLIPGKHRFNLHAIYLEAEGKKIERDKITPEHFANWIDWAKQRGIGLDFNPTCFSHPKAASGFTLASHDAGIRKFWIDHCIACRKIAQYMGKQLGSPSVCNVWIPDGYKDIPADRKTPRELLRQSLDEVFAESLDKTCVLDSVESKLFGIGSESYVVGSHEFYLAYAVKNNKLLCLDTGHFHPTELVSDKITSVLTFLDEILLHVSRGIRWDSDHVVILSDELQAIAAQIVHGGYLDRVHIGLDFFDASINRVAAWVIGARSMLKALLLALLAPIDKLKKLEHQGDFTARLAMLEELKTMPWSAVWDYHCLASDVPVGPAWLDQIKQYEKDVTGKR